MSRDTSIEIDPFVIRFYFAKAYQILGTDYCMCFVSHVAARTSPEAETLAAARRRAHVQCSMLQRVSLSFAVGHAPSCCLL